MNDITPGSLIFLRSGPDVKKVRLVSHDKENISSGNISVDSSTGKTLLKSHQYDLVKLGTISAHAYIVMKIV